MDTFAQELSEGTCGQWSAQAAFLAKFNHLQ
jgi:hypothetical protein